MSLLRTRAADATQAAESEAKSYYLAAHRLAAPAQASATNKRFDAQSVARLRTVVAAG
jgi:hypothetical protein